MRHRARNAASHRPCRRQAASRTSRWCRSSRRSRSWSLGDQLAAAAVDPAHRIDHLLGHTVEPAFDVRVEPTLGCAPIDDALRELVAWIVEGENLVGTLCLDSSKAKCFLVLARRRGDIVDAVRAWLEP